MNKITSLRINVRKIKTIVAPLLFFFSILMLASSFKSSHIEYKRYYLDAELLKSLEAIQYGPSTAEEVGYIPETMAAMAGTIDVPAGSVIIDMGVTPQTIENGLKPYGLVVSMLNTFSVPVIWSINPSKSKDGVDFSVDGRSFKGGPFIISAEQISAAVQAEINLWRAKGVVTYTTQSMVNVPLNKELTYSVRWVINQKNSGIPIEYMENAEIVPSAYSIGTPLNLNSCSDLFLIPHADPDWPGFGNPLLDWNASQANGGNSGWIWAGCQAVSNLERDFDPTNANIRTNFLARDPAVYPGPFDGYGLIEHGEHDDASGILPYPNAFPTDPIMQYMGRTDEAHDGGSEQIYLPYPTGGWRTTTKVGVWDPNQEDVLNGDSPGKAALIAYGRAFGESGRGMVLYEGGHKLDNGTEAENVAAQRVFFNFALESPAEKAPIITNTTAVPTTLRVGETIQFNLNVVSNTSLTYQWSTTCPSGSFNNTTIANPIFTAGAVSNGCLIKAKVTDGCGRISFLTFPIIIEPSVNPVPIAVNDSYTVFENSVDNEFNVLVNDSFGTDGAANIPIAIVTGPSHGTAVVFNNGTPNNQTDDTIKYTPNANYFGNDSLTYRITDNTGDTSTATVSITVEEDSHNIAIIKTGIFNDENGDGMAQVGETISYAFNIKNTGAFKLRDIVVTDDLPNIQIFGNPFSLNPGESKDDKYSATYAINQADIDRGKVTNQAIVRGTGYTNGLEYIDNSDFENFDQSRPTVVILATTAKIAVIKTGVFNDNNGNNNAEVGETITYSFTVTNTGNKTLRDIAITDPLVTVNGSLAILEPLASNSTAFTATYTITQNDINNGEVVNQAIGVGCVLYQIIDPEGCCEGGVTQLTLRYDGSTTAQVRVLDKDGNPIFTQTLSPGQQFTLYGDPNNNTVKLSKELEFLINNITNTEIHTSCSQPIGPGLVSGSFTVISGMSLDGGPLCPLEADPGTQSFPPEGCCEGKVTELTLKYIGTASSAQVRIENDNIVLFNGVLNQNENVTVNGTDPTTGEFEDNNVNIFINGTQIGSIHVSCSQPVGPGLTVGGQIRVVSGESSEGGELCPVAGSGCLEYSDLSDNNSNVEDDPTIVPLPYTNTLDLVLVSKTDILCYGANTGSITVEATGGRPPYQYNINGGPLQSSATFNNLTAGVYILGVTDANGFSDTLSVTLTQPERINIQITKQNATTSSGCTNGKATATPTGGLAPYTYQWSASAGNQTTATATNLPEGTHQVVVTDANGCSVTQSVVIDCINDCDAVIMINSITHVSCKGDATGAATVSASSQANPAALFTFTWNTVPPRVDSGVTSSTINNLQSGVYTVSVTIDGTVCLPVELNVTINEPSNALNVSATSTDESGPNTGDGTATANPSGGTPPYTYSWSPGGQTTRVITGLSAGQYTVTVTDSKGCTATATTTVNPGSCQGLSANATSTPVSCNGNSNGTATVSVSNGVGPFTYSWSPGGATTRTITNLSAGTYTVTVTDQTTLCTVNASTTVSQPNVLSSGIAITSVSCFGGSNGSLDLTVTGGTQPYSFSWSNGATTEDLFGLTAGTYSVTITDANGCTATNSATVLQPNAALALTYTVQDVLCNGQSTGAIDITVTGGTVPYRYNWSNGATTQDLSNIPAGVYNVTVTDANGCTLTQTSITVGEPSNPISVIITKENATTGQGCNDGEATASPSGGVPPYTYMWSASAGNQTTATATNLPAGTHTVTITDANGCELEQGVVIICDNTCDAVISVDQVTNVLCAGNNTGSATVSASSASNPAALFTFTWDTTPPQVYSGVTSSTINNLSSGIYTVSVTIDGTVCQPVEQSVTITEPASVLSVSATSTDESGPNTGDGTATANPVGGTPPYTYSWSPGGQTTRVITGLSAGVYTVTVTDANGCTATSSTTVNPGTCRDLAASASSTPVTCNGNSNGTATVSVTGGSGSFTYLWSPGGQTTPTITGLSAGSYSVVVTDTVTLCTVNASTIVNEPNLLTAGIAITHVRCFGDSSGSLDLTVTGGTAPYSFLWSNGATTEDLINLASGTYSVIITDANGCTATKSATITQPSTGLTLAITSQTDIACSGFGSVTVQASGGTVPYLYRIDGGGYQSSGTFNNLTAGNHIINVLDANNCSNQVIVNILSNCVIAIDDINDTFMNLPVSGDVSTNDLNPDGPAGTEVFTLVSGPTNGTVAFNGDGTYTYTPGLDFVGADIFEYQICDGGNPIACDTAMVYIEVLNTTSGNDAPIANADTNLTEVDTPVSGNVLVNDFDPDGDPITVTANTNPSNGTVVVNPDGSYTYTPNAGYEGQDTFEYTICDNGTPALCDTAVVTIQVVPDNGNITVANDDAYFGMPDTDITGNVLDNDFDPEGDNQTVDAISPISGPSNGTLVINANGTFTYTPNAGYTGTDQFVYEILDDGAPVARDMATVYISIDPNNGANEILAVDDINDTFVNLPVSGDVSTNDLNPDGPAGTEVFTLVSGPTNGTVAFNGDGTYTYTPGLDFVGADIFEYQICDGGNPIACDTAMVYIEVLNTTSGNDAPIANADTNLTEVDTPVSGNVLVNDFDPDGDPITVTANTNPSNGTVVVNPDGSYTYTPNAGYEGQDTFEYTICDNGTPALCDTAVVTIQVVPDNGNITVANDDAYFGMPDTDITGNVLDNDFDPEGDNQTVDAISPISGPSNGTLVINANGTFTYTPNAGYTGTDQFVYEILDDGAPVARDMATVYISIDPNNGANEILAVDDINDTFVNLPVSGDVSTNDLNPDGPAGTEVFTLVSGPTNGTVAFNGDGTYTYTPGLDFVGADIFEYQICDGGNPIACDTAMVYIEVLNTTSGNDAPIANADTNLTEVDTPVSGNVLVNDFDPDGDPITVTANTNPSNGTVVVNPDGSYTYTPNAGYEGQDTFEYTICDNGTPALCDTAVVTIQVVPDNGNITVANDDAYFGMPDTDITGNVLDNDFDPEGDNQTVDAISPISGPSNGTLVINANGTFTYTPNAGYTGTDQFVYEILDDGAPVARDMATVYISIDPNNGANEILAVDDINDTFVNLPVSGDVSTNDLNPDGPAGTEVFTLVSGPTNGTVAFNGDGTYTYTPGLDFVGADIFEYQICDGGNPIACDTAMVYIEVLNTTSGNDAPIANADTNLTEVDTPVSGNVLVNDFDPDGDPITVTANTNPSNGTVVVNPDGSYTYTPNAGYEGQDTFEYTICDNGTPALCDTAVVTIQVVPDNGNITVANDDAYFGMPDTDITGNVLDNDFDPEGDNQTVDAISPISGPSNGTLVINANGTFTYTPNAGYTGTDQFVYEILDDGAPVARDMATVYISIDPNNGANEILAVDDINDTFVNLPVSGDVSTNDLNPDGPAGTEVFTLVSGPTNGTVAFNGDGTYTYTPGLDFVGADIFEYQICDGGNPIACDTAMVYIEVLNTTSGNDAPIANADTNLTEVDTPVSGNVLVNDFDPDGDPITVTANTNPSNGTVVVNPDGSYTYTPNAGYEGQDTFEYTICDNGTPALCDTAVVTIQVVPDNGNITVANDDAYFGMPDTDITGNVLDNDFDPEGDNQTVDAISPISGPSNGTLVINANGTFTYTPNAGYTGTDQFVYEILDDGAPVARDMATVYISIDPNNGANEILAVDDINDTFVNLPVSGDVSTNDLNPDGPAGTEVFTLVSGPTNGTVAFNGDGTYTYTPGLDFVGADIFEYQICDGGNPIACDTAMVYIEVLNTTSGNDAPIANADTNLTEVDTPVSGNVLVNDFDPDGDPITVTANTNPSNGTVVVNPDGSYTYTPNAGYEGQDTFEYTICDNGTPALCDTAVVTIQVVPDNGNITVANDDAYFGMPDTDITGNVLDNDFDPEGDNQTVDAISPISGPSNGTLVINANGTFTYTPNAGYTGTDQFVYEILDDGAPVARDMATVYISIDPNNGANEILAVDDINDTFVNLPVSGDVSTNDLNPDGPAGTEVFTLVSGPTNGTVAFNGDGTYTYTPGLDFVGADIFEYQICDGGNPIACDTAMVYIEVLNTTSGNDAPIANADTNLTEVDTPVSGNVLVNDFDPDGDPITVTANTNPSNGTVVVNPDGSYTYTPNAGYEGQDTFEYTICDNGTPALCDTAVVTIQVVPDNGNITVANDDAYFGMPDTDITGNVLDNDFDPEGDNQTVDAISPISGPSNGTLVINANGTFTYTPNAGYTGTDQFVYEILDDGAPVARDMATVYLLVQKTPEPAIAIVKTAEVNDQNQDGCTDVGETISYTFTVTNEGNVPLSSILVTDPLLEDPNPVVPIILVSGDDGDGILQETEIWLFTAEYAITQLDIELGEVINQATVIGTAPDLTTVQDLSGTQNDNDEPTATDLCQIGGMSLQLTAEVFQLRNINLGCSDGDAIRFTYILKNVGNGIISDLNIIHDDIDLTEPAGYVSGDTNGDNKLDIEEEWTYESLYLITQEDIEAGILITQASATGIVFGIEILELSDEDQTIEDNDPTIIEFCQYKTVSLEKTGIFNDENGNGSSEVGETISYTFSVINTGNVTLNNVVITDPLPGVVITGDPILTLLPEDVNNTTFTAVYSITQEDIDNGEVVNQAKVTGTTASGIEVTDDSDDPTDLTNFDNNGDGEPDDPTVVILPDVLGTTFEIFNGITPNGDGFNDFFLIQGISDYPVNNVKIFNRWGVLVYETDGYGGTDDSENVFKGISEGRVTIEQNKELPTGTYFYILTFPSDNPGNASYNGYLYINR